jgi:hypothetical protein
MSDYSYLASVKIGGTVTAESAFRMLNMVALAGWLILAAGIVTRRAVLYQRIAGWFFPVGFGVVYATLIAYAFDSAEGSFSTLGGVRSLFQSDWLLVAGWVHYLAFDLFVGSWIARKTLQRGLPRLILVPILPLTFMFGPAGLVAFAIVDSLVPNVVRPPANTGAHGESE